MVRLNTILLIGASLWALSAGVALAEVRVIQRGDGTSGTITHLGDNVGIYSDAQGNTGPVISPNGLAPSSGGPHGDTAPGHRTPFGTPAPPSNLTPAPVLPFNPNRPLVPQQPSAPSTAPGLGSSSGGRFGR